MQVQLEVTNPSPPPPPQRYKLEMDLNEREAKALATFLNCFGGDSSGPSTVARSIRSALRRKGIYAAIGHPSANTVIINLWEDIL